MSPAAANKTMAVVALLFLLKTALLALFVTPLWDVPDESGHVGYVLDLADGRGLPVYGRTPLPPEVLARWKAEGSALPPFNWVAQHPPLYYAIASPFAAAARAVSSDPDAPLKAPRLASVLASTAALLVLFRVLREATDDAAFAVAGAASVSFVPMYSHLAAGAHNEPLLVLAIACAALWWARCIRSGKLADALRMSAALGLAGAVKLTALPVTAALLALVPRHLTDRKGPRKTAACAVLAAVALAPPAAWLLRNWLTAGHPLVYAAPEAFSLRRLLGVLAREPVFDHTLKNFLGLIGWMGTGELRWFQISGVFFAVYFFAALLAAAAAAAWLWGDTRTLPPPAGLAIRLLAVAIFAATLLPAARGSAADLDQDLLKQTLFALVLALPFFGLAVWVERGDPGRESIRGALWVVLLFLAAYLWNVWRGYAIYGEMRAVHGRYFFAVVPFLLLGFGGPAARLIRSARWRLAAATGLVAALAVTDTAFFLSRVLPFYRDG